MDKLTDCDASPLRITHLRLGNFRNISQLEIQPAPRFNVISGDNGQGKTSLLEAIYFVATSRSFRADRLDRLRKEGEAFASAEAFISEGPVKRCQRALYSAKGRVVTTDGDKPSKLSDYALQTPVVVFHPGDLQLTMGPAATRRDLLDRVALFTDPSVGVERTRYRQVVRDRQKILETRGEAAPELADYETLIAHHGSRLTQARQRAVAAMLGPVQSAFERIVASSLPLKLEYQPGGGEDPQAYALELMRRRSTDRRRKMTSYGPHRDDLALVLDGRLARHHASQGQHRILTLTLKLAELAAVRGVRGAHPLLLLDDVSSELDPTRIGAVYDFLAETESQVFVTTTRPTLFETPTSGPEQRRDYTLVDGRLQAETE